MSGPFRSSPLAYATPVGSEAVGRLLRWAHRAGVPLIPRGAGTGMPGGNLGPQVVVEIGPGLQETEILPETGHLRVGAGATGLDADEVARSRGRFLPFLPSSRRWCRIGGMVGTNAAGARTFGYGAICDWVVALEGFLADGSPFRVRRGDPPPPALAEALDAVGALPRRADGSLEGWPSVRKNSSGYALDRALTTGTEGEADAVDLLIGSEGTLAVVTNAELETAPLPESVALALVPVSSPDALADLATAAEEVGAAACEFLGRRLLEMMRFEETRFGDRVPYAVALVEVEGIPGDAADRTRAFAATHTSSRAPAVVTADPGEMEAIWALRRAASPVIAQEAEQGRISTQFIEDSVVPPARLAAYLSGLDEILGSANVTAAVFGHAGDANVHVNPLLDITRTDWLETTRTVMGEVVSLVSSLGGSLSGEHGDGRVRTPYLPSVWPEHLMQAFRLVKARLDPAGRLNPGVVVPLADQDPFEGFHPRPRSYPDVET